MAIDAASLYGNGEMAEALRERRADETFVLFHQRFPPDPVLIERIRVVNSDVVMPIVTKRVNDGEA